VPFLTTSTGCPQTTVWACCIPLPTMEFAWLCADQRRFRRHPTFPTGAIPFGVFPSRSSGHHHRTIAGSFTECPAPHAVGFLSSCMTTEAVLLFERRPHHRGVLTGSPLLTRRVAATGLPDTPLGFSPTLGFHPSTLLAIRTGRSRPHSVRVPAEAGPLQITDPPKRTCGTNKTVVLESSGCHFHRLRGRHRNPGSRSRTHGFPHAPSMPKHLAGATAFRGASLPMCRVTAETHSSFRSERPLAWTDKLALTVVEFPHPGFPRSPPAMSSEQTETEVPARLRFAPARLPARPMGSSRSYLARQRPR
jgi:hypothetical protein